MALTVKELIKELSQYPKDSPVCADDDHLLEFSVEGADLVRSNKEGVSDKVWLYLESI